MVTSTHRPDSPHRADGTAAALPAPYNAIAQALHARGYGGSCLPPCALYVALTTRVLARGNGTLLGHTFVRGPAGAGKTFMADNVLALMPPDAYVRMDASSQRAYIYDDRPIAHRVLYIGEIDSLPHDSNAISGLRMLTQSGELRYDVTIARAEGGFDIDHIHRAGPTVLLTTGVGTIEPQMLSRMWLQDMAVDSADIAARINALADIPDVVPDPPPALIALQQRLQDAAPVHVTIPYARALTGLLSHMSDETRMIRDTARLLSVIRAAAAVRIAAAGDVPGARMLSATLDDYRIVYTLFRDLFSTSAMQLTPQMRTLLMAVDEGHTSLRALERATGMNHKTIRKHVQRALDQRLLVGDIGRGRSGATLALPPNMHVADSIELPTPDALAARASRAPEMLP